MDATDVTTLLSIDGFVGNHTVFRGVRVFPGDKSSMIQANVLLARLGVKLVPNSYIAPAFFDKRPPSKQQIVEAVLSTAAYLGNRCLSDNSAFAAWVSFIFHPEVWGGMWREVVSNPGEAISVEMMTRLNAWVPFIRNDSEILRYLQDLFCDQENISPEEMDGLATLLWQALCGNRNFERLVKNVAVALGPRVRRELENRQGGQFNPCFSLLVRRVLLWSGAIKVGERVYDDEDVLHIVNAIKASVWPVSSPQEIARVLDGRFGLKDSEVDRLSLAQVLYHHYSIVDKR